MATERKERGDRDRGDRGDRGDRDFYSPKSCRYCADKALTIDYKDGKALRPFLTERDKIIPRRMTGLCAFHQRVLMKAIKRALILGMISFTPAQRQSA